MLAELVVSTGKAYREQCTIGHNLECIVQVR